MLERFNEMIQFEADMNTLRTIAAAASGPLDLLIGVHHCGPASTMVRLRVDGRPGRESATLNAHHADPEGSFCEETDATIVLDRVGESALDSALETLSFPSGTPTVIFSHNDLAAKAPAILD